MSPRTREIISRSTMAGLSLLLFWAAWMCFRTAWHWQATGGARYPIIAGVVLAIVAFFLLAGAALSSDQLLRIFGVGNTTLRQDGQDRSGWISWIWWI